MRSISILIAMFLTFANVITVSAKITNSAKITKVMPDGSIYTEWESEEDKNVDYTVTPGSGKCGDNLNWELNENGKLTISGTGDMYNYVDYTSKIVSIPWFENNDATVIKSVVIENGVESISDMAFYGTSIRNIFFPDSVKKIGSSSIANCKKLLSAYLSDNIENIPDGAFNCDSALENVAMPSNLKSIGESAFIHCWALKKVMIPPTVTSIKTNAFMDCIAIDTIVLPENMSTIELGAFWRCIGLKSIAFSNNCTKIEDFAFSQCANLENIILPDGLEEIGEHAFSYNIENRDAALSSKTKLYVPKSVKKINKNGINENSVIYGFKDSEAERFAEENGIQFVEVTESMYNVDDYNKAKQKQLSELKSMITVISEDGEVKIFAGNEEVEFPDAKPFIDENGRTQIPIRAVVEELGCSVTYDEGTQTVSVKDNSNGINITLKIGNNVMQSSNGNVIMDTAAKIIDDRTYIPVRFVAEALGYTVNWTQVDL